MNVIGGFDFGTVNSAMGVVHLEDQKQIELVTLPEHGKYLPSTLYSPNAQMISGWLYRQLQQQKLDAPYQEARKLTLSQSLKACSEAKLDGYGDELYFGQQALQHYLVDPADCYYVRSPKSFLGASGISDRQQQMFEDISASLMWQMRRQVAAAGKGWVNKVVIGRPVHFQGHNAELNNRQAINVLTQAAKFVGFEQIEFLYEPIAAGLAYQQQLTEETKVLVIDIGGGTSDITMLLMGPQQQSLDHSQWVLGTSGERVGGNDFDIQLNRQLFMPHFGSTLSHQGRSVPLMPLYEAAQVNHLSSQTSFYSLETKKLLQELLKDKELHTINRLLTLQKEQMTFQLSHQAELAKIALSSADVAHSALDFIEQDFAIETSQAAFAEASSKLLARIGELIDDALAQAGTTPDVLFLTGGSANSPLLRQFLEARYPQPLITGDNFGSVTAGLTHFAAQIYQA